MYKKHPIWQRMASKTIEKLFVNIGNFEIRIFTTFAQCIVYHNYVRGICNRYMRTVWFPISTSKVVESSGEWKGMLLLRAIRWNYKLPWHLCKFWIIDGIHSCGIFRTTNQLMARLNEQCLHGGTRTFRASDTIFDPIDSASDNQPGFEDAKGRFHVAFVSLHQH